MKISSLTICLLFLFSGAKKAEHQSFSDFCTNFAKVYRSFNIPELRLSYAENFQNIQPEYELQRQTEFFQQIRNALSVYEKDSLTTDQQDIFDLIDYETDLNLQRLALEKKWIRIKPGAIPTNNFHAIPNDSAWYIYYLQKWLGAKVHPDELYLNGLEEIERVQQHIKDIQLQTGMDSAQFYQHLNDSSFFLTNETQVRQAFEETKNIVLKNLGNLFNITQLTDVSIKRGTNTALARAPGYYSDNTFYYNFFDTPYNKRQVAWLFIHEAIPGHHYEAFITTQSRTSEVQQLFHYPAFNEGWAAYTEELGKELGAYKTPYDELGKWEWDLVRSVRVPLDIGLNYYGWNDDKALAFWKKYIPNRDDIAMREINRMRSWPAQVITYKYGASQILKWKKLMQLQRSNAFDIKAFHEKILQNGASPFFLMQRKIFRG
jgi:uncharacterized protein (DUF885 family)